MLRLSTYNSDHSHRKPFAKMSGMPFSTWDIQQSVLSHADNQQRQYEEELLTPFIGDSAQWAHAHTSSSGYDYFHPIPGTMNYSSIPGQEVMPLNSQQPLAATDLQYVPISQEYRQAAFNPGMYTAPPTVGSEPMYGYSSNLILPSTTPSIVPSSVHQSHSSRSPSPHPSLAYSSTSSTTQSGPSTDLNMYGNLNPQTQTWTCAYPNCSSRAHFSRPCDLRKHFNRHNKNFFCRYEGCPQSREGGFSSKKDRARHESKHNPGVQCEWEGCERVFSRVDNMRNHLSRIHHKQRSVAASASSARASPSR